MHPVYGILIGLHSVKCHIIRVTYVISCIILSGPASYWYNTRMDTQPGNDRIRAVEIDGEIWSIKTNVDGAIMLVLRLQETCSLQAGQLLQWHKAYIRAVIELIDDGK